MKKAKKAIILFMSLIGITFYTERMFAEGFYDFNQQEVMVTIEKADKKLTSNETGKRLTKPESPTKSGILPQTGEIILFSGTAIGVCLIGITVIYVFYKRKQVEGDAT